MSPFNIELMDLMDDQSKLADGALKLYSLVFQMAVALTRSFPLKHQLT